WDALSAVLGKIRAQDGPITGIMHGAGRNQPCHFGTAPAANMRKIISPKLDGTLALMLLTMGDPIGYFVGFGSLSGRLGGHCGADAAASTELLAKLCGWYRQRRPECRTTCLHWQSWAEIGMATVFDSADITKNTFKMNFIPPAEGVAHLVDELRAGAPEAEVL